MKSFKVYIIIRSKYIVTTCNEDFRKQKTQNNLMLQFHENSPEMGKCIIYRKLLTILILDPGFLWKSASAHTQSTSLLLQNHLQKENISMKKKIPPSISLSSVGLYVHSFFSTDLSAACAFFHSWTSLAVSHHI